MESPSYDRANTLAKRSGANVVSVPVETDGVDLNKFEEALKKNRPDLFYIIADFQNPMGITTSAAKRTVNCATAEPPFLRSILLLRNMF